MILLSTLLAAFAAGPHTTAASWNDDRFRIFPAEVESPPPADYPGELDAPPVLHWSVELPGGRLTSATHTERTRPVVVGGYVLVGSAAGRALYLMSRRDGTSIRDFPAEGSVESAATVIGDRVFFADTGGMVWCYELDGDLVWSHQTGAPVLVDPTVVDGVVYVTNVDDLAVALDATSGQLQWQYQRKPDLTREAELALYAKPPAVVLGRWVLLGFSDGSLVALDRERGDEVWAKRIGEGRYPDLVAAPVPNGSDIFTSGYFEPLVAIDQATHNVRWRLDIGAANAVAVDGSGGAAIVYHPGTDGKLRAITALTGAEQWTWDSETGGALTTPVVTPAGLVVGSADGGLWIVDPKDGTTSWTWPAPPILEGVTSSPTVAGRQLLFVTDAGRLYSMVVPKRGNGRRAADRWHPESDRPTEAQRRELPPAPR